MICIGVDAHKSFSTIFALEDETSEILLEADQVPTDLEAFAELFSEQRWEQAVAVVEASNISCFVAEMLKSFLHTVRIADPKVVRQMVRHGRPKTDKVDAQELAYQLSRGLIYEVYQHTPTNLAQRALVRGLRSVTANGSRLRNQIRALLAQFGHECPASDLAGKSARDYLAEVELRPPAHLALAAMAQALFATQEQRAQLQTQVKAQGRKDDQAKLLQTIPGVGPQTALTIVTEVGDIRRFPRCGGFVNYCGLAPSVQQSGNRRHTGRLIKGNKYLRLALTQAANALGRQRGDTPLHQHYRSAVRRLRAKQAKLDTARKIARITHAMLHSGKPYRFGK